MVVCVLGGCLFNGLKSVQRAPPLLFSFGGLGWGGWICFEGAERLRGSGGFLVLCGVLLVGVLKSRGEGRVWGLARRACARAFALLDSLRFLIERG